MNIVQTSGKQQVDNASSLSYNFTSVTANNSIIVAIIGFGNPTDAFDVSDGDGKYSKDLVLAASTLYVALFRRNKCSSGTHATVITPGGTGHYITAVSIEVDEQYLFPMEWSRNNGNSTTPGSGTPENTVSAADLIVGVLSVGASPSTITVESTTPSWTQQIEETNFAAHSVGEVDTKFTTSTGSYPANWTLGFGGAWVALVQAYAKVSPGSLGAGGSYVF